jgi:hypothetical protein
MREKEAAIIEASVLLITLMFIILPVYVERIPSPQAQVLSQFSSAIGFVFVVAVLFATFRMFGGPEITESMEAATFSVGLALLAALFAENAWSNYWALFLILAAIIIAIFLSAYWKKIMMRMRGGSIKDLSGGVGPQQE